MPLTLPGWKVGQARREAEQAKSCLLTNTGACDTPQDVRGREKSWTATSVRFFHGRVVFLPRLPDQGCRLFILTWRSALQLRELGLKVTAHIDVSKGRRKWREERQVLKRHIPWSHRLEAIPAQL